MQSRKRTKRKPTRKMLRKASKRNQLKRKLRIRAKSQPMKRSEEGNNVHYLTKEE